jgi:hypothetical protein
LSREQGGGRVEGTHRFFLSYIRKKYLESFDMCYSKWFEKISCADRVRNEVLHRVKEERNILKTKRRRKTNCIGQIWRGNCLLKHVIEGKTELRIEVRRNEEDDVSRYRMTLRGKKG